LAISGDFKVKLEFEPPTNAHQFVVKKRALKNSFKQGEMIRWKCCRLGTPENEVEK